MSWLRAPGFISSLEGHGEVVTSAVDITQILVGCVDMKKLLLYKNITIQQEMGAVTSKIIKKKCCIQISEVNMMG